MHLQFQKQTNFVKLLHENFLQLIFLYLFYKISRKDTKKKQIQRDPICTKLQQKICINQDNVQWLHEQKIQNQALHSPLPVRYFYPKKKKKATNSLSIFTNTFTSFQGLPFLLFTSCSTQSSRVVHFNQRKEAFNTIGVLHSNAK